MTLTAQQQINDGTTPVLSLAGIVASDFVGQVWVCVRLTQPSMYDSPFIIDRPGYFYEIRGINGKTREVTAEFSMTQGASPAYPILLIEKTDPDIRAFASKTFEDAGFRVVGKPEGGSRLDGRCQWLRIV